MQNLFKKLLSVILSLALIATIMPQGTLNLSAKAETELKEGYYKYTVTDGKATIIDCDFSISGDVTIPETLGGYPVISIGEQAFYECYSLKSITIPGSVVNIGDGAFSSCSSLKSINVDSNNNYYSSINGVLFNKDKTKLVRYPEGKSNTEYTIPDSVKTIGNSAFEFCDSLESITIGDSVTSIGDSAFCWCESLESITIPDSVTSIGDKTFYSCYCLESIDVDSNNDYYSSIDGILFNKDETELIQYPIGETFYEYSIPDSVESIGDYAFAWGENLEEITIPDSVINMGEGAFAWCNNLEYIFIWYGLISIGDEAFYNCYSLTSINIPYTVKSIGDEAFYSCESLEYITIPDEVTTIGDYAFSDCYRLENITIGEGVATIGDYAFNLCESLANITVGEGVKTIGDYAFKSCHSLEDITFGGSIKSIGNNAFNSCNNLESIYVDSNNNYYSSQGGILFNKDKTELVTYPMGKTNTEYTIPNSVTNIGGYAFHGCYSLESITIPNNVTSIGNSAFHGCYSLVSITIPKNVTTIGNAAFNGCGSLKNIDVDSNNNYYSSTNGVLFNKDNTELVRYPEGKTSTKYYVPDSVTGIGDDAFWGCDSLESIAIPGSVVNIGDGAFYYCESLKSINVDSNNNYYSSINGVLFNKDRTELIIYPIGILDKEYIIPDSVVSIGDYAFYLCYSLESITIPNSVTSIGTEAFYGCYSLENITYLGTKADWESVNVKEGNEYLSYAIVCQPKNVELSATLYTYNGKVKSPSVIVKTASGETVSTKNYSYKLKTSGKYVGEHKITVTFKGDYSGTKNLYFTIKPGSTTVKKLTPYTKSIKVYLNKKTTQTSGYQIEWSTSKKFTNSKKALIKSNKTTSYTIKSLSRKKTYYVRVRTYKTVNGERIYSSYSSYKYTKTK